jgi:hypothetical protein
MSCKILENSFEITLLKCRYHSPAKYQMGVYLSDVKEFEKFFAIFFHEKSRLFVIRHRSSSMKSGDG